MKILQLSQEYLAILGIESSHLAKNHSFNREKLIISILLGLNILLTCLFLLYEAKNFKEGANCFYWIVTDTSAAFDYALYIYMKESLFNFIENFEKLIQKSK